MPVSIPLRSGSTSTHEGYPVSTSPKIGMNIERPQARSASTGRRRNWNRAEPSDGAEPNRGAELYDETGRGAHHLRASGFMHCTLRLMGTPCQTISEVSWKSPKLFTRRNPSNP